MYRVFYGRMRPRFQARTIGEQFARLQIACNSPRFAASWTRAPGCVCTSRRSCPKHVAMHGAKGFISHSCPTLFKGSLVRTGIAYTTPRPLRQKSETLFLCWSQWILFKNIKHQLHYATRKKKFHNWESKLNRDLGGQKKFGHTNFDFRQLWFGIRVMTYFGRTNLD